MHEKKKRLKNLAIKYRKTDEPPYSKFNKILAYYSIIRFFMR